MGQVSLQNGMFIASLASSASDQMEVSAVDTYAVRDTGSSDTIAQPVEGGSGCCGTFGTMGSFGGCFGTFGTFGSYGG